MKKKFPLELFLQKVRKRIPKDTKLVDYISECVSLGKDACYRRLRGEVEFTVDEIFKICSTLSISLDKLIGGVKEKNTLVETRFMTGNDIFGEYKKVLDLTIEVVKGVRNSGDTKISFVCDSLPMIIMGKLRLCHKLRFYKWHYTNMSTSEQFSEFEVPKRIYDGLIDVFEILNDHDIEFIFDKNLFSLVIDYVNFFYSLGKITLDEINEIKKEILEFTDRFEAYINIGQNYKEKSLRLFSSHITIETSAILIDNESYPTTAYNLYSANTIVCRDQKIFQIHKGWLAHMKKSCSLISGAGDVERINYFNFLREELNKLPA